MLYFTVNKFNGKLISVDAEHNRAIMPGAEQRCRWDFPTMADAEAMAAQANALPENAGRLFIAADAGGHTSPRYDVIEAPTLGAEVSKGFNGDYYPCGKIAKISKSLKRIETDDGTTFYRRGLSGAWLNKSMWSMVPGVRKEWNPSF